MQDSAKVLVVGTTADYIDWIRRNSPGQAFFITDHAARRKAQEPCPLPDEEILCDLSDYGKALQALHDHLKKNNLRMEGVASYDCESLELTALLAQEWALPYPSVQAVNNCRNKYLSKMLWKGRNIPCPSARLIRSEAEAIGFLRETGGPCVLKPIYGSGSEFIFRCDSEEDCIKGFQEIQQGLHRRQGDRLYRPGYADDHSIFAETFIDGEEFSCDFIIEDGRADIIRLTRKILSCGKPFGTTCGYLLSDAIPDEIDKEDLLSILHKGADALGITRAICMLDFKIHQGRIYLLELSPRPGGDCLPFLLYRCLHLDMLKLNLDFYRQPSFSFKKPSVCGSFLGLRIHAPYSGTLRNIDTRQLQQDPRVKEIRLTRRPGHRITMPPADYDSWLLGHIIMERDPVVEPAEQCEATLQKVILDIE